MKRISVLIVAVILSLSIMLGLMMFRVGGEEDVDSVIDLYSNTEYIIKRPISVEEVRREVSKINGLDDASSSSFGYSSAYDSTTSSSGGNINIVIPSDMVDIILMSDDDAWAAATNGVFSTYPSGSFTSLKSQLEQIEKTCGTTIVVPCWKWKNSTSLEKESSTMRIYCNKLIAPLLEAAMNDIYNLPSKPVLKYGGCWNVRKMTNSEKASAHAYGCAIDFNTSSVSKGYGNVYGGRVPDKREWDALPENQTKYEIFYRDCDVVKVFKSYGFYWGGDFNSNKDAMHFGFLGDYGKTARKDYGITNYNKYH